MKNRRLANLTLSEALAILKAKSKRGRPVSEDSFVIRIARALDVDLARLCEICEEDPVAFLELLTGSKGELVEYDVDPMWRKLEAYVNERIAQCLAVRMELERKMQADRKKQLYHRMRQKQ